MLVRSVELPFSDAIGSISQSEEARAYIINVFQRFATSTDGDMSKKSLVVSLLEAKERHDFVAFQKLGDWALWSSSCAIGDKAVLEFVGTESYAACHRMVRSWNVFKELSMSFSNVTTAINKAILHYGCNLKAV